MRGGTDVTIVLSKDEPIDSEIALQTRKGTPIANNQCLDDLPFYGVSEARALIDKHSPDEVRLESSPIYNCHGLCFASRRTRVYDVGDVRTILREDGYVEVKPEATLPGDVVLYMSSDGRDIEHTALLVTPPSLESLWIPVVLSKWGSTAEAIHLANRCPYHPGNLRYYRVTT